MGRFVKHESCPECGSRDNLARYDDGSAFCFGCQYHEKRTHATGNRAADDGGAIPHAIVLSNLSSTIGPEGVAWLRRYGVTVPMALGRGIRWDPTRSQLVFSFTNREGEVVCTQGRNFDPRRAKTRKYDNSGSAYEAFPLYLAPTLGRRPTTVVITEDPLSAIRIARQCSAIPCLGTNLPVWKINALRSLGYQRAVVWLDKDKWREGREIADKFKWVGLSASTLLTALDPKCYSDEQIKDYLQ
jgi:Zn ribbon nucleic-acid-binding protein